MRVRAGRKEVFREGLSPTAIERELQIRSREGFQLKISITCPEYGLFKFCIGQFVRISLRGASMAKLKGGTSAIGYMSFHLVFKDGASVKFLDGRGDTQDGLFVNSWQGETFLCLLYALADIRASPVWEA